MAKGPKMAAGDMDKLLDKLNKMDLKMETNFEKLEKLDKLDELQRTMEQMRSEMAVARNDLNAVQGLAKETKDRVDDLEGGMKTVQKKGEERGNVLLNLQLEKMAHFLRFQNVLEEEKENLRDVMVTLLNEYMTADMDMGWDIDQVYRVNTLYATTHGVPREVHVRFLRRETREQLLKKQREQVLQFRGRDVTILKQIPRQVRELRRKYHFLSNKLYLRGVGFRWLMPEGLMVFREGSRKRINTVAEAKAYMEENKTLLEAGVTGAEEEGEVLESQEVGTEAAEADPGGGQVGARVLRSRTKK